MISPTAAGDDDVPYTGLEMPEHQPTVRMNNVIQRSGGAAYKSYDSSQVHAAGRRVNSMNSRSRASVGSEKRKIGLDQLLSRKSHGPGSSHKLINTRNIGAPDQSQHAGSSAYGILQSSFYSQTESY